MFVSLGPGKTSGHRAEEVQPLTSRSFSLASMKTCEEFCSLGVREGSGDQRRINSAERSGESCRRTSWEGGRKGGWQDLHTWQEDRVKPVRQHAAHGLE